MYQTAYDIERAIEAAESALEVVGICRASLEADFWVAPIKGLRTRYDLGLGTTKKFLDSLVYLNNDEAVSYLSDLASAAAVNRAKRAEYAASKT